MAWLYLDTSALIKRYLNEVGSAWVRSSINTASGNIAVISSLAVVEAFSVFARRERDKQLLPIDAERRRQDLLVDLTQEYVVETVSESTLLTARNLTTRHMLRALDAIQLACALQSAGALQRLLIFVCADNDLLLAASKEGFAIDNPLNHP